VLLGLKVTDGASVHTCRSRSSEDFDSNLRIDSTAPELCSIMKVIACSLKTNYLLGKNRNLVGLSHNHKMIPVARADS
jgi:hypothetical protein